MDFLLATTTAMLIAGGLFTEPDPGWAPLPAETLDATRGGFGVPGGLKVDVGIQRLVTINGEVVVRHQFHVSGSGDIPQAQVTGGAEQAPPMLIQNGAGNQFDAAIQAPGALVIQNSLSNQAIRSETVINATVNSMSLVTSMNFQESVGLAVAASLRSP